MCARACLAYSMVLEHMPFVVASDHKLVSDVRIFRNHVYVMLSAVLAKGFRACISGVFEFVVREALLYQLLLL